MGLPLLAFYIFLIAIFYAFIAILLLIALILGVSCMRFSKRKIYPGLSKLSISMIIFFTLLVSNPLYWPAQIHRHIDVSLVITPNDAAVQQLNSTTPGYMWDYLNTNYGVTPTYFYNNMTDDQRLENMTAYILGDVIEYHFIPEVYGVIDYVSTPAEAIGHGEGDCHSRTIVMVSLFIFMGYDAWACETPFHWYTMVNLNGTPHYYYRDVLDYLGGAQNQNWAEPQIMFNNETIIHSMNIFERLGDTIFGIPFYNKIYELFSIPEVQIAIWPMLAGIGFLMTIAIRCTNSDKKRYFKNGLLASLILVAGFFIALLFSHVFVLQLLLEQIVFMVMLVSVALAAQSVQSDLGGRLFSKK